MREKTVQIIRFYSIALFLFACPILQTSSNAEGRIVPQQNQPVIIDPGHGGIDSGATGPLSLTEKKTTLLLSQLIQEQLPTETPSRLTRTADIMTPIDQRPGIANHYNGKLFVSIHTGARNHPAREITIYHHQPVAESAPINIKTRITWDEKHLRHAGKALASANLMAQAITSRTSNYSVNVVQAPLRALVGIDMPGVLIEVGNLTDTAEKNIFLNHTELSDLAKIIASAINTAYSSM